MKMRIAMVDMYRFVNSFHPKGLIEAGNRPYRLSRALRGQEQKFAEIAKFRADLLKVAFWPQAGSHYAHSSF